MMIYFKVTQLKSCYIFQVFDYEYDSDEDWEDEGEGESLSDAEDDKEEEDDYEVSWVALHKKNTVEMIELNIGMEFKL